MLIPFEPAPQDPDWMIKVKAGKRLTPAETELYLEYSYNKELEELKAKALQVPGKETFAKIMFEYSRRKSQCLSSFDCIGMN